MWSYFQSVENNENNRFIVNFADKYGANRKIEAPMEAGYFGVYLWAQAVKETKKSHPSDVLKNLGGQGYPAPEGIVYIDPDTHHTWKNVRIGRLKDKGQFEIVWDNKRSIRPIPFPTGRTRQAWKKHMQGLYQGWGNHWAREN